MEWAAILRDIVGGLLIAGAAGGLDPRLASGSTCSSPTTRSLAKIWGPLIGPLVAVVAFVCSIGNVPLAAVLWNGGISFGGVISFIFADLIIIPILVIYAKYYGRRMAWFLFGTFYVTMVAAGYVIELVFTPLGPRPDRHRGTPSSATTAFSGTTPPVLNIVFLLLAAVLVWRFLDHRRACDARDDGRRPGRHDGPPRHTATTPRITTPAPSDAPGRGSTLREFLER